MTADFREILRPADEERHVPVGDHETLARIRGDGDPVVLIHSLGVDARLWDRTAGLLADAGARSIAYDVRGHGSAMGAPPSAGVGDLVADLVGLLDGLAIEQAVIAGTSMGGVITQAFMGAHPERVAGAAILTSPARGMPAFEERAVAAETSGLESIQAGTLERWFNADLVEADGPEIHYARACLAGWTVEQWAASWRTLASFVPPVREELPEVPVVLIAGDADASTPPALMEQIRERIPGEPRMVVIPGGPHLAVLTHHAEVARILADLVRG